MRRRRLKKPLKRLQEHKRQTLTRDQLLLELGAAKKFEAHIFVAFMAYCLQITLKHRLRALAPGLTPRSVLEKMAALQMVDVHLPTTDGRCLILSRYTQPETDQQLLLSQLKLEPPAQPPPKITSNATVPV